MRPNLINRLKEEWNNLDPVDPLRGLIADAIDALTQTASKQWVGLTDEQISDMWDGHTVPVFGKTGINPIVFARAIEAKLREKNA